MIIPVRCFSCGKLVGDLYEPYMEMTSKGITAQEAFEKLKVRRWCCKRAIVSQIDLIDDILNFPRLQ